MGDLKNPGDFKLAADGVDRVEMERIPDGHRRRKRAKAEVALCLDRAVPSLAKHNHHRLHCGGGTSAFLMEKLLGIAAAALFGNGRTST